jgi:hypothetical protein
MTKAANDNFDPWQSIGLQAALIVNKLRCQAQLSDANEKQDSERSDDRNGTDRSEQDSEQHRAYVDQRLRDFRAFERRAGGKKT